jgi:hypothetical protein
MTWSQFVLYMSQPSIVVTLKIVHEQQSKRERERKVRYGIKVCTKRVGKGDSSYRKSPVGGPIHSPKRPHRSPKAKPSETGIAI